MWLTQSNRHSLVVTSLNMAVVGMVVTVPFLIACTIDGPSGSLQVSTATTGSDLDPNGYTVAIVGAGNQPIGVNDQITIPGLPARDHDVRLSGVASNCTVSGANPRTVSVPAGGSAQTAFSISCTTGSGNTSIPVWRRAVISIENTTYSGNPFELEIDATFTHSGTATEITLPGYYAGNDTWKIGFMPTRLGDWSYVTSSSDADLNGRTGTVTAVASSNHGLLAADATYPRKWKFADGPYVAVPTMLRMNFFSESATQAQFDAAADFMAANNILMLDTRLQPDQAGMVTFTGAWQNHQFNLTLWDQMEARMDALAARGLGAYIMFYTDDAGTPEWGARSATEALVIRYVVARLAGYPIVWFDSGIDIGEYRTQADINWWGAQLQALDPYGHPASSRYGGGSGGGPMVGRTYESHGDNLAYIDDLTDWFNVATMPVAMTDSWGENYPSQPQKNFTPADIRRSAWKLVMAGGLATSYRGDDGYFHIAGIATGLESEQWLKLVKPFVQDKLGGTFGAMVPTPSLVTNGYCLADPARTKLLYFLMGVNDQWDSGDGGSITVKLTGLSGSYNAIWFDPRLGTESSAGTLAGGSNHVLAPPSNDDWVLLLTRT
jgi:hypothetical protein